MMNIKYLAFLITCLSTLFPVLSQNTLPQTWKDTTASVLATVDIGVGKAVVADILWGLPFPMEQIRTGEEYSKIKIYNHKSGLRISNFYIREITSERLTVAFEPLGSGQYDIYFAPEAKNDTAKYQYLNPDQWTKKLNLSNYPDFNSLNKYTSNEVYFKHRPINPLDYIATDIRASLYFSNSIRPFQSYLVPWYYPVNEYDRLPNAWVEKALPTTKKKRKTEPQKDTIKTVWTLLTADKVAKAGIYDVSAQVINEKGEKQTLPFVLKVTEQWTPDAPSVDFISAVGSHIEKPQVHGSTLGGRLPTVVSSANDVLVGKHKITVNRATALPSQVICKGEKMFSSSMLLVFSTANGIRKISVPSVRIEREGVSSVVWKGEVETHDMKVEVINTTNAYGVLSYKAEVTPKSDVDFRNITLEFDFSENLPLCGYDTFVSKDRKEYAFAPKDLKAGVWIGGDTLGACLSVPRVKDNAFFYGQEAKISLYHGSTNGVIVGTGAFSGKSGNKISLQCDMQLLPANYSFYQGDTSKKMSIADDDIFPKNAPCDIVLIKNPFALEKDENVSIVKNWNDQGKKIYLALDGYVLPSQSLVSRILASMKYQYTTENEGSMMRFLPTQSLVMPFRNMHKTMCMPYYISGVVFSPLWYDMIDVEGYYELKKRKKTEFNLMMTNDGMGAGVFRASPWLDAIIEVDKNEVQVFDTMTGLPFVKLQKR